MTNNSLTLFCVVNGESTPFSVKIESTKTIDDLKKLIKAEKTPEFNDIAADKLTLWRVSVTITDDDDEAPILLDNLPVKKKLRATSKLSMVFDADLPEDTIHVLVQRPQPATKRDREDDAESSSSRKRHRTHTLMEAIEEAGLTEKAVVDGRSNLSRLDNKERITLLEIIGQGVDETDKFYSLSSTALELQGADMEGMDKLSAPHGTILPVINTTELYVRKAYKDLHRTIINTFDNDRKAAQKHVVVT
ncbi:hypothetical protein BGZ47_004346, partial [Haplosporangium gracile]